MHAVFLNPRLSPHPFDPEALAGAALYRAGRYVEAERLLEKGGVKNPEACVLLAMTAHQLGKKDKAEDSLVRAVSWFQDVTLRSWQERLRRDILLAEATRLIRTPPQMPKLAADD